MTLAEVLLGGGAAMLVGRATLPRGRGVRPPALAEDLVLGLSLVVPLAFVWGTAGLPWGPVSMPVLALALAALLRLGNRRRVEAHGRAAPADWAGRAALALLGACFLVAAWKWIRVPLWSWDHFAIWGMKARRVVGDGALDLGFLKLAKFVTANPDYPIGLPLAWRFLSPSEPSAAQFRLCHALLAGALAAAVYGCARRLHASTGVSALAGAVLCASPLFWDTEAVGLADLPLACVATAALLLALEARDDSDFPAWTAGAALGFLVWIKTEGVVLAALLAAVGMLLLPNSRGARKRRGALGAAWLASGLGALAIRRFGLSPGRGFFEGDWSDRVAERARNARPIFDAMLENLSGAEWLGLWVVFAAAILAAFAFDARPARLLAVVVLGQLGFYAFVYFGTFMDPLEHVHASFHRLAAALAPLALLTAAAAAGAVSARLDGKALS